ncbi:hypothetical protein H4R33_002345 [Dimargaris cristalligena]|nr:hypothetical protein H4R33_002345 [Dimargaris cristalligena]
MLSPKSTATFKAVLAALEGLLYLYSEEYKYEVGVLRKYLLRFNYSQGHAVWYRRLQQVVRLTRRVEEIPILKMLNIVREHASIKSTYPPGDLKSNIPSRFVLVSFQFHIARLIMVLNALTEATKLLFEDNYRGLARLHMTPQFFTGLANTAKLVGLCTQWIKDLAKAYKTIAEALPLYMVSFD